MSSLYEAIWKTLFIIKAVEQTQNENFLQLMAAANKTYEMTHELAPDAATLSGLYNCEVCGEEKCSQPGICKDCLTPPADKGLCKEYCEHCGDCLSCYGDEPCSRSSDGKHSKPPYKATAE